LRRDDGAALSGERAARHRLLQTDFEFEPHDDTAAEWRAKHQESYRALGALERYNSGPVLAHRWLETGLARNVVGEPTNVMVTRDCLARIGTFALHIRQRADMDLWLRAMLSFDVGFVDRPLTRLPRPLGVGDQCQQRRGPRVDG
jgi:hypothetical protein